MHYPCCCRAAWIRNSNAAVNCACSNYLPSLQNISLFASEGQRTLALANDSVSVLIVASNTP